MGVLLRMQQMQPMQSSAERSDAPLPPKPNASEQGIAWLSFEDRYPRCSVCSQGPPYIHHPGGKLTRLDLHQACAVVNLWPVLKAPRNLGVVHGQQLPKEGISANLVPVPLAKDRVVLEVGHPPVVDKHICLHEVVGESLAGPVSEKPHETVTVAWSKAYCNSVSVKGMRFRAGVKRLGTRDTSRKRSLNLGQNASRGAKMIQKSRKPFSSPLGFCASSRQPREGPRRVGCWPSRVAGIARGGLPKSGFESSKRASSRPDVWWISPSLNGVSSGDRSAAGLPRRRLSLPYWLPSFCLCFLRASSSAASKSLLSSSRSRASPSPSTSPSPAALRRRALQELRRPCAARKEAAPDSAGFPEGDRGAAALASPLPRAPTAPAAGDFITTRLCRAIPEGRS